MKKLIVCLPVLLLVALQQINAQYARLEIVPYDFIKESHPASDSTTFNWAYEKTSVSIKFYSDAACTHPYTLPSDVNFVFRTNDFAEVLFGQANVQFSTNSSTFTVEAGESELLIDDIFQIVAEEWISYNSNPSNYQLHIFYKTHFFLDYVSNGFTILPNKYPFGYLFHPYY